MTATFNTWIRIGGQLATSRAEPLLCAIAAADVSTERGETPFAPDDANELLAAGREGYLLLGDPQSKQGKFPQLESTCRLLELSYTRFTAATDETDAELVDFRPEMSKPLVRTGSSADWDRVLIDVSIIQQVLSRLYAGQVQQAIQILAEACPPISELPPFELVEEGAQLPREGGRSAFI